MTDARDRMQSIRQMVLQEAGPIALSRLDFEELVALCAELSVSGRQLLEKEYDRIFKEPNLTVAWLQERRRVIEELSDNSLELAQSIRSASQGWSAGTGNASAQDIIGRVDSAIQSITETKRSVLERWPVGSVQEIAEDRAAIARGEDLDAEAAFAQIAGVDMETWHKRVEEYKQNRPE